MADLIIKKPVQRKRNLGVAFFIIGIFLVGTVLVFYLSDAQQNLYSQSAIILPPAVVSYNAPNLSLTGLDGSAVSINDYSGKVILVDNWATWCPPCKDEMPELQKYFDAHFSDGFVVVAIESGEPATTVESFVQDLGISFPVWLDPKSTAVDAFKNWDLPSTYVIDRKGIVRLTWTGQLNVRTLEKYVTPLLEE